ncbi:hypothetical protein NBRC110019_25470 [Neptunitalea chrysea]|uniref:Threonine/Serine exporter ThrE domain-containing protein n=1 Tax=Neptunitalea chrysea TaxID=1647581 RepID=A0A9W6B629_9FLAO|nr:threonine/serine exporter family protein [Neptunitalea chrysea]GLB53506.1 hypothetical protein NBRC110019_25470 [Neptunitalea chrysea]
MDVSIVSENWIWFGIAAVGFAILFNVPRRTLLPIFVMAALGGTIKLVLLQYQLNVVLCTLCAAVLVGFLSIYAAHFRHSPPFVFAIPAVIPMVPGSYAYHTMKGVINLSNMVNTNMFNELLYSTVSYGLKTMFVLLALSVGVFAPMLITRRNSAKEINIWLPSVKIRKK